MRFGLSFVNGGELAERDAAAALAQLAEELGFSTLWAADHVVVPVQISSTYPRAANATLPFDHETRFAEPVTFLAYVAALTTSIRLGTGVLVLAEHNPLEVAKAFATLDRLSGGRVNMGIGTGWLREEFEALGVSFEDRLARTTEGIEVLRRLWAGPGASFAGTQFEFPPVTCSPRPVQPGGIPIFLGGYAPAAVRRAGRIADGHYAGPASLEKVASYRADIARGAAEAGRDPGGVKTVISLPRGLELTRDLCRRYEDAGVDEIVILVPHAGNYPVQTVEPGWFDRTRAVLSDFGATFIGP